MSVWNLCKTGRKRKVQGNRRARKGARALNWPGLNATKQTPTRATRRDQSALPILASNLAGESQGDKGQGRQACGVSPALTSSKENSGPEKIVYRDQIGSNSSPFYLPFAAPPPLTEGRLSNDNYPVLNKPWHRSATVIWGFNENCHSMRCQWPLVSLLE